MDEPRRVAACEKAQAAAEAGWAQALEEPPFSQDTRRARRSFLLPYVPLRCSLSHSHILALRSPFMVFSFSTCAPSYFHVRTCMPRILLRRVQSYETTHIGTANAQDASRDPGRAARLYASVTLNHNLEIIYVRIDSYYYKAYVGRACALGGPHARAIRTRNSRSVPRSTRPTARPIGSTDRLTV